MSTCPTCGATMTRDADHCTACGAALREPAPRRSGHARVRSGVPWRWAGATLLLLGAGVAALLWAMQPRAPKAVDQPTSSVEEPGPGRGPGGGAAPQPAPLEARRLGSGELGVRFIGYDMVANGLFALVDEGQGEVTVHLVEWQNGTLQVAKRITHPAGKVLDVSYGDMLNEGYGNALITTEKGLLFVQDDGKWEFRPQEGLLATYVGDWDGDGQKETAYFHQVEGQPQCTVYRYQPSGRGEKVGSFRPDALPRWMAATVLDSGNRRLLLGASPVGPELVEIGLFAIDPTRGLERRFGGLIPNKATEPLISSAAGVLGGKAGFAATYRADPSYIEVYEIMGRGIASRGRITLPDSDEYFVIAGRFTGSSTELLAISRSGKWILFGLS
ncbi:MAG: hypothetical protein ACOY93_05275 [Bacillota bacterium]